MQSSKSIKGDSVTKNYIYQSAYQVLSLILPFVTAPYIARVFGTEGTGIYSYTNSVLFFFTMVANLGISNYGNREIASNVDDVDKLSTTFWGIYFCHFFMTLITLIAYCIYVFFIATKYVDAFLWQSIQIFATLFNITWFFSGIQKFKITVRKNLIIRLITVALIFLVVKKPDQVWRYILILAAGNFVGQVVVWTQLKKYIVWKKVSFHDVIVHFRPMLILFIPVLAMSVYRYMDKIMIPIFSNISELGLYENSEKVVSLPLTLITTIGVVLLPKMSNLAQNGEKSEQKRYFGFALKYSSIFAIALTCGLIGIAPVFAPVFFGEEFRKSGELISLLAITILFLTWSNSIRSQWLIPNRRDNVFIIAAFSGSAVNLVLNIILISKCGAKGAVYATIITEFIVTVVHVAFSKREIQYFKIIKSVIPFMILGFLMTLAVRALGSIMTETILTLVCQTLLGMAVYICIGAIILRIQHDPLYDYAKGKTLRALSKKNKNNK